MVLALRGHREFETLTKRCQVYMCLFMPVLNGCVNTLLWPVSRMQERVLSMVEPRRWHSTFESGSGL